MKQIASLQEDTLYHCISLQKSTYKIWAFDDFSHLFPHLTDKVLAKPIYLFSKNPSYFNPDIFKHKVISGEKFINLIYQTSPDCGVRMNSCRDIKRMLCREIPGVDNPCCYQDGFFADAFIAFDKSDIVTTSVPKTALRSIRENNTAVNSILEAAKDVLELSDDQIGLTGSLALGARTYHDIDLVIYGGIKELNRVQKRIQKQISRTIEVFENGLKWPCRFYDDDGNIICCFFNIEGENYLDSVINNDFRTDKKRVAFSVRVADDVFSLAKTPFLFLDKGDYDTIVILSRAFRSVFKTGDIISGVGYVAGNSKTLLCIDPFSNIENWEFYFNR